MLRRFSRAEENHRNIFAVPLAQDRVFLNIHFAQRRAEFLEQRRDRGLRFFAEVAPGTRVERHVPPTGARQPFIFRRARRGLCDYGLGFA